MPHLEPSRQYFEMTDMTAVGKFIHEPADGPATLKQEIVK